MSLKKIFIIIITFFFSSSSYSESMDMIGEKGDPNMIDRVIKIKMYDLYYEP